MERLTLDEAIKRAKEVADMNYNDAEKFDSNDSVENYMKANCMKCAEQHEKLAEWLEELKSYKEAEEHGLLVRLPCKVGNTVYVKLSACYKSKYIEAQVRDYAYFISCGFCVVVTSAEFEKLAIPFSEFGKTVFLTREAAEKKLEEF